MNNVEESINKILRASRGLIPEDKLDEISRFVYKCQYNHALWAITHFLDPFESVERIVSLLIHSWDLFRHYTSMLFEKYECEYQECCAEGRVYSEDNLWCLEQTKLLLQSCEEGKKRALRMRLCQTTPAATTFMNNQTRMYKAKCN
jgi:hypothetical protein